MRTDFFINKTILILSPQPWGNLFISKHNYARELALHNKVIYVSAPGHNKKKYKIVKPEEELNLNILEYNIPLPETIKFHLPDVYRFFVKNALRKIIATEFKTVDICIDFGCYQQFKHIDWVPAKKRIFFPVDDHDFLRPGNRGADFVLSVSRNICDKFTAAGLSCHFINHGLNREFEENALAIIEKNSFWKPGEKIRIGYSGNLFIPFLDIPVLKKVIEENDDIEFHFFGATQFDGNNNDHVVWNDFLRNTPNVILHGFLHPKELVRVLNDMDGFILCYKPDYKNYHAENSHKVFEYLSTGRVLITTYLSIYKDNPLMIMADKDKNEELINIFTNAVESLEKYNSWELQNKRIALSLDNAYGQQIKRISNIIYKS